MAKMFKATWRMREIFLNKRVYRRMKKMNYYKLMNRGNKSAS